MVDGKLNLAVVTRGERAARMRLTSYAVLMSCALLSATVFVLDLLTPDGVAIPSLYAAVVLFGSFSRVVRLVYPIAVVASVLILAGIPYAPAEDIPLAIIVANRGLYLVFVWITALVLDRIDHQRRLLEQRDAELARLAREDALTGLANRREFDERLATEYQRALRSRAPLSLLMADVDHFKRYNDTRGHQAGDNCLAAVARAIRGTMRRPSDFAARYGGEEFVVLLPDTERRGARAQAESMRAAVAATGIAHPASVQRHVTISVGVASARPSGRVSAEDLLRAADRALYDAKRSGRNRVHVHPAIAGRGMRRRRKTRRG